MKLEQQVSNLELSKKLKGLGVKQESLFMWIDEEGDIKLHKDDGYRPANPSINYFVYSAFTVAEILKELDEEVLIPKVENVANYLAEKICKKLSNQ